VAKANRGRRERSRKRRRAAGDAGARQVTGSQVQATRERRRQRTRPGQRGFARGGLSDMLPVGERPQAPWHPLPLSELLILVGAIGFFIGLTRGISNGAAPLIAGLVALAIGTVEVTLREHLSGYRSHAIILAALPVVVLDSLLVLVVSPLTTAVKLVLLVVDVGLFVSLFRLLRARFADARRERRLGGR
jgi:hypothetical protein